LIILVFDLTKPQSLDKIEYWIQECFRNVNLTTPIILAGAMCDLQIDPAIPEKLEAFKQKYSYIPYFETSAKDNINVKEMFVHGVEMALLNAPPCEEKLISISKITPEPKECCWQ